MVKYEQINVFVKGASTLSSGQNLVTKVANNKFDLLIHLQCRNWPHLTAASELACGF